MSEKLPLLAIHLGAYIQHDIFFIVASWMKSLKILPRDEQFREGFAIT